MPDCHPITLLELDARSLEGIKRIQQLQSSAKLGSTILAMGKVMMILYKSNPTGIAYNVSTTDWEQFTNAMKGFPDPFIEHMQNEADYQRLDHPGDRNQRLFWEGIRNGCKPN